MTSQWYYGYGDNRYGPFSGLELRALAEIGRIQPMDTIWKQGIEEGVPAHTVKHLFPEDEVAAESAPDQIETATQTAPPDYDDAGPLAPDTGLAGDETDKEAGPSEEEATPPPTKPARPTFERKGRATAIRGAIISSQDGSTVFFRKKCTKCGHEETGRNRMPIRNGVTRSTYFCPKCRKVRPVEIQGSC